MKLIFTRSFIRDYRKLPKEIQKQADRKLELLKVNRRHPSLRVHKIKKTNDVLEGSITKNCRFSFRIEYDSYILRRVGSHDIIENP